MVNDLFHIALLLVVAPVVFVLQVINLVVTTIQYCFVHKKYNSLQQLFSKNSEYVKILIVRYDEDKD